MTAALRLNRAPASTPVIAPAQTPKLSVVPSLHEPEAPLTGLARSHTDGTQDKGALVGAMPRAVSAVLLGASAFGAFSAGAPIAHAEVVPTTPPKAESASDFLAAARALEANKASMTADELAAARKALWTLHAQPTIKVTGNEITHETRGEARMRTLARDIESRMRVTAYDMAHPQDVKFIDGVSGYKELSKSELKKLGRDALKDVPLGELPGGKTLASWVRALPGAGQLDAENMTAKEIQKSLGKSAKQAFDAKFGDFIDDHKVTVGIVGFSAVTAARIASPEAAKLLDKVLPEIELFEVKSSSGRSTADGSLHYRDARVLPDVDLKATTYRDFGPVRVRAELKGVFAVEKDDMIEGRATLGARVGNDRRWVDLSGSVDHKADANVDLELGVRNPDTKLKATARAYGRFHLRSDASDRVGAVVDFTREVKIGKNTGELGIFGSHERDLHGGHDETSAGLIFRMRF